MQRAHARDQHARTEAQTISGGDVPGTLGFIPNRFAKASVETDMRSETVTLDAALEVIVDFLLARIHAGPFGRWSKGKRIKMRRNIARAAGVAIVPPGAANIVALLDDEKRFHAGFKELDAHADAGEARAHDEDVNPREGRLRGTSSGFGHARATTSLFDSAGATCARKKSALSRSDWRASGI